MCDFEHGAPHAGYTNAALSPSRTVPRDQFRVKAQIDQIGRRDSAQSARLVDYAGENRQKIRCVIVVRLGLIVWWAWLGIVMLRRSPSPAA